jgi:uncharacterized repeat protein (TIGR01451 family)
LCNTDEPEIPQPVRTAYDPNDKQTAMPYGADIVGTGEEARTGRVLVPISRATEPLTYTIRFENVPEATAAAETVTITDVLDDNLDPASLEFLGSTGDSLLTITTVGQVVTFTFSNINLPPNQTSPEGEGAVTFRVRPRARLPDGTEIHNEASIVFDFNPPILTPEVIHVVRATSTLALAVDVDSDATIDQPLAYTVTVVNGEGADPAEGVALVVPVPFGATLVSAETTSGSCSGTTTLTCALGTLDGGETATVSVVVEPVTVGTLSFTSSVTTTTFDGTWFDNAVATDVLVAPVAGQEAPGLPAALTIAGNRPNPFRDRTTLRIGLPRSSDVDVAVFDLLGREVLRAPLGAVDAGWHDLALDARGLAAGAYIAVVRTAETRATHRLVIVR